MTPAEAAEVLRKFNAWRRGDDDDSTMLRPKVIGEAIDVAIAELEKTRDR